MTPQDYPTTEAKSPIKNYFQTALLKMYSTIRQFQYKDRLFNQRHSIINIRWSWNCLIFTWESMYCYTCVLILKLYPACRWDLMTHFVYGDLCNAWAIMNRLSTVRVSMKTCFVSIYISFHRFHKYNDILFFVSNVSPILTVWWN